MKKKQLSRIGLAGGLAVAGATLLLAGCAPHPEANVPAVSVTASNVTLTAAQQQNITLATVQSNQFHKTVDTTGTVTFDNDQSTTVLSPVSGPVAKLLVDLGDQVKEGQPLAQVDSPDFATAISTYQKTLATAKIDRQLADQDQELLAHHGVSAREADQAKIDAINAEADSQAALSELQSLKIDADTMKAIVAGKGVSTVPGLIRSPVTGTVVDREITPGELLEAGTTPCYTVANLSKVWVMANLFGPDIDGVSVGDSAEVAVGSASSNAVGAVENISSVLDPDTRAVAARVVVSNPAGALKKEMYVRVLIHAKTASPGMMAPVSAILRDDENLPFVYVAQTNNAFARQRITVGYRDGDQYDITSGLKPGERIVANGALFVQFLQNQ